QQQLEPRQDHSQRQPDPVRIEAAEPVHRRLSLAIARGRPRHCATRAFAAEIERSTGGWLLRRAGRDRLAYELADAAQRTDQLRRFDREQDGLGVRAGRELADRLGVLLRDEIVDRLVAT